MRNLCNVLRKSISYSHRMLKAGRSFMEEFMLLVFGVLYRLISYLVWIECRWTGELEVELMKSGIGNCYLPIDGRFCQRIGLQIY